ncbi:multidrug efflux SMR transporter [Bacteriovorax sp. PP10]|uniref:Multidrug efflux SMR transporter n=1 Tax=Bacteriovorax antarcticus TaxID=3088717 RepID=A0ABU5VUL0_9BACT|nr:multidrug efflux SMR transporter [Bacteriovorax sp. PP10]MEA9356078.1 multidrug efflux SMR transporter [Bacteriovorax sp. PP10]
MHWIYLVLAIVAEVVGTACLKSSNGFQNILPSIGVVVGYGLTIVMLSISVKSIPMGTAYAIWSGVGTVGAVCVGYLVFSEKLHISHVVGMACIILGSIILKFAEMPKA